MKRLGYLFVMLLCMEVLGCASLPLDQKKSAPAESDPIVTQTLIFKHLRSNEVENVLKDILKPEESALAFPQREKDASRILLITAHTSTIIAIVQALHDELDETQTLPVNAQTLEVQTFDQNPPPENTEENADDLTETPEESSTEENGDELTETPEETSLEYHDQQERTSIEPTERQRYIYYVKHGTASALKKILDKVFQSDENQELEYGMDEQMPDEQTAAPRFVASDIADEDEYGDGYSEYSTIEWDDLEDSPQAFGNFLTILATPEQYADISAYLQKIDAQPLQVFLSMTIAEVTLLNEEIFGIEETLVGKGQITTGGETNAVVSSLSTEFTDVADSMTGFRYALLSPGRFLMKLRALATENRLRLISSPQLFVRNNRKALIYIGETIPVVTYIESEESDRLISQVDEEETGISLAIVPSIHPDGYINIELVQEVANVGSENYGNTGQASFVKRQLRTSFDLMDGEYLLLGGLISQNQEEIESGVPLLRNLPLFGRLFKSTQTVWRRTELILYLNAEIVTTSQQGTDIYHRESAKKQWWLSPEEPFIESYEERIQRKLRNLLHTQPK